MSKKALRVPDYIGHMLDAMHRIRRYCESKSIDDFNGDEQLQDAVVRNIEIIGDAARNIAIQALITRASIRKYRGPSCMPCVTAWRMVIGQLTRPLFGKLLSATCLHLRFSLPNWLLPYAASKGL